MACAKGGSRNSRSDSIRAIIIQVKVVPRASREEISVEEDGVYKVKLTAPALEGKANKALVGLLSKRLHISKSRVEILSGEHSRTKKISIDSMAPDDIGRLLVG